MPRPMVPAGVGIMPVDALAFRLAMRRLAAGVCLITTEAPDGTRCGLTATAVCSVSAQPPTLLCCINRQSASHKAIVGNKIFAVNVLALDDRSLADQFAKPIPSADKFAGGLWTRLETYAPVLESALASFDCRLSHSVEVGTHAILFGEILAAQVRSAMAKPLLYAHGGYGHFASVTANELHDLWMPTWDEQHY
jgi:flavin reductase (DIM6/NTAB) family NADH-FMN oxidoreductase RutF